jgi:hypothetical protein
MYNPFDIKKMPGATKYSSFTEAQAALKKMGGKGTIVAFQYSRKGNTVPANFATFHGTYWEYANHGGEGMLVVHSPSRPEFAHEEFIVVPTP